MGKKRVLVSIYVDNEVWEKWKKLPRLKTFYLSLLFEKIVNELCKIYEVEFEKEEKKQIKKKEKVKKEKEGDNNINDIIEKISFEDFDFGS